MVTESERCLKGWNTWNPEGSINPTSTYPSREDEAIIFSAPEALFASMRIRLRDLMWIPMASDLLSI